MRFLSHRSTVKTSAITTVSVLALGALLAGCSSNSDTSNSTDTSSSVNAAAAKLLPASVKKSKTLNFGAEWDTPPMISVSTSDTTKPQGIAVEIAADLSKVLGVTPKWQNMQFPSQIPGLQSGNVDVLLGQVSVTAEREKGIVDLTPFYRSTLSMLVAAGNPTKVKSLADACGLTIGSVPGSILTTVVNDVSDASCTGKGKDAIKIAEYSGATGAISAVKAGTIDAWLDSTSSQLAIAKAQPSAFSTVEVPVSEQSLADPGLLGAAVSKSNPGISKALAAALKVIIEDGSYTKILSKYGLAADGLKADDVKINPLTGTAAGEKASS